MRHTDCALAVSDLRRRQASHQPGHRAKMRLRGVIVEGCVKRFERPEFAHGRRPMLSLCGDCGDSITPSWNFEFKTLCLRSASGFAKMWGLHGRAQRRPPALGCARGPTHHDVVPWPVQVRRVLLFHNSFLNLTPALLAMTWTLTVAISPGFANFDNPTPETNKCWCLRLYFPLLKDRCFGKGFASFWSTCSAHRGRHVPVRLLANFQRLRRDRDFRCAHH